MALLAIDSAIGTSVAIVDENGEALSEMVSFDPRSHIEVIAGFIEACMVNVGMTAKDLSGVAVGIGPAPFTGLRVGIAAAKGFALGASLPLFPVSTHAALALSFWGNPDGIMFEPAIQGPVVKPKGADLILVTDAKRGEYFQSVYLFSEEVHLEEEHLEETAAETTAAADSTVHSIVQVEPGLVAANELPDGAMTANWVPAEAIGALAIRMLQAELEFPQSSPIYLRAPDVTPNPNLGAH